MSTTEAKVVLSVVDRITAPLAAIQRRIDRLTAPIRRISRAIGDMGRAAGIDRIAGSIRNVGSHLSTATGHAGAFLARLSAISGISLAGVSMGLKDLWMTNASFEVQFMRIGELFGKDRQKEVMDWAVQFDRINPGGIEDIVNNLARLKAFGIDGTVGPLKALVDFNSKIGGGQEKLSRIILAVGQMMSKGKIQGGEMLQLTEAGVPAMQLLSKATGKTVKQLEEMQKKGQLTEKHIRALIGQMGKEANGAGAAYMATAEGIIDKFQSTLQGFKLKIGDAGAFGYMKAKLDQFADWVNALDADGAAQRISDTIISVGTSIETALKGFDLSKTLDQLQQGWQLVKRFGDALAWLSDRVGGPVNLALGTLAAFTFAPLIASLISITGAVWGLGVAMATTPIGWFVAGLAAIGVAGYAAYRNWSQIREGLARIWSGLPEPLRNYLASLAGAVKTVFDAGMRLGSAIFDGFSAGMSGGEGAKPLGFIERLVADAVEAHARLFEIGKQLGSALLDGIKSALAGALDLLPDRLKGLLGISPDMLARWKGSTGASGDWAAGASGSWSGPAATKGPMGDWGGRVSLPPSMILPRSPMAAPAAAPAGGPSPTQRVGQAFGAASAPQSVPVVQAQPDVNVSAPMSLNAKFDWASEDAVLSQVRAMLQAYKAQSEARIRSAIASSLAD